MPVAYKARDPSVLDFDISWYLPSSLFTQHQLTNRDKQRNSKFVQGKVDTIISFLNASPSGAQSMLTSCILGSTNAHCVRLRTAHTYTAHRREYPNHFLFQKPFLYRQFDFLK